MLTSNMAVTLRRMASQASTLADLLADAKSREVMLEIAQRYEALAIDAESRARPRPSIQTAIHRD